jgi:hypothetical protein
VNLRVINNKMKVISSILVLCFALCCYGQLGIKTKQHQISSDSLIYDDKFANYRKQQNDTRYFRNESDHTSGSLNVAFLNKTKTEIPKGLCYEEVP